MAESSQVKPCVLVVADPDRASALVEMLRGPEAVAMAKPWGGELEVVASSGGDDTLDDFGDKHAEVVVVTATLSDGDTASLIDALRGMVPRAHVVIIVVGDVAGPIRTMVDAFDLQPDRFVSSPVQPAQLRYAVAGGIEAARMARGPGPSRARRMSAERPAVTVAAVAVATPLPDDDLDDSSVSQRALLRARWSSIADSMVDEHDDISRDLLADHDEDTTSNVTDSGASEAAPLPPPLIIRPRHRSEPTAESLAPTEAWRPGTTSPVGESEGEWAAPQREPTLIIRDEPAAPRTRTSSVPPFASPADSSTPYSSAPDPRPRTPSYAPPADSRTRTPTGPPFVAADSRGSSSTPYSSAPDPRPRAASVPPSPYQPLASLASLDTPRRVTNAGIGIPDQAPAVIEAQAAEAAEPPPERSSVTAVDVAGAVGARPESGYPRAARSTGSSPVLPLPADRLTPPERPSGHLDRMIERAQKDSDNYASAADSLLDDLGILDDFDDALVLGELSAHRDDGMAPRRDSLPSGRLAILEDQGGEPTDAGRTATTSPGAGVVRGRVDSGDLFDQLAGRAPSSLARSSQTSLLPARTSSGSTPPATVPHPTQAGVGDPAPRDSGVLAIGAGNHGALVGAAPSGAAEPAAPPTRPSVPSLIVPHHALPTPPSPEGRDFARQLRAKMSKMAERLFQGADAAAAKSDVAPRHDHSTEIDLASLGEELQLGGGVTEIEARSSARGNQQDSQVTHPGSWNTQVRERGLPDQGEVVRGVSDAAMLLAKMFATGATGRLAFRRDDIEKIIALDQGRPVFASSSDPVDRMGELLVREGKITASQYERCQTVVAESGRRMGEILVDFGYLKRRELLPAVRRHVEDILYSLFGWDRGTYQIFTDVEPSAERIRLSRHPASLVLEGIRRKFDRTSLDKLLGGAATVIEVADRERLGGIINLSDLSAEERAALAAFDGQVDLAQVARVAQVDTADVMPLAWGLCTLGLATARRTDTQVPDESSALVGETDLVIDRERVRARWQLVTEADYFALLGVRRDASSFEIRRAYQSARRDFAADCFPGDLRRELAQELDDIANVLDEAFRVLRDDRLRLTYLSNLFE